MLFYTTTDSNDFDVQSFKQEIQLQSAARNPFITIGVLGEGIIGTSDVEVLEYLDNGSFKLLQGTELSKVFVEKADNGRFCFVNRREGWIISKSKLTIAKLLELKLDQHDKLPSGLISDQNRELELVSA